MKKTKIAGVLLALGLAAAELLVQLSGIIDMPLYQADNQLGYIPAPNQSGAFLHSRHYRFNEYSMGSAAFEPDPRRFNLLLVGDSIVLGGNPINHSERLGPQLEKISGWQVWPVSAGSWALQNELAYLRKHPDVLGRVDAVAIVLNSGDFGEPSSWVSPLTHPLERPFPALLYVFKKYALASRPPFEPKPELRVSLRDWRADLRDFSNSFDKPVYIFMYPGLDELHDPVKMNEQLNSRIPELQAQLGSSARVFKVADLPDWKESYYRDGVHPTAEGNAAFSRIIIRNICKEKLEKVACPVDHKSLSF
jgi:hypothetical protein